MTSPPSTDRPATDPDIAPDSAPTGGLAVGTKLRWLLLSLAILVLDQWTKWLVEIHLPLGASHPVIPGFFDLTHVLNTGVAFGLLSDHGATGGVGLLIGLGLFALATVGLYFHLTPPDHHLLLAGLALVVGGALGNLLDRVAAGGVTDFVDLYVGRHHWPAFNVADSAILIGIGLLVIDSFRVHREERAAATQEKAEAEATERRDDPRAAREGSVEERAAG